MDYTNGMKTKKVTVTLPQDLIDKVKQDAKEDGRSFSNLIGLLVKEGIKNKAA